MLCFTLQAILFYVPRWLWKNWEAGKIHALMMDLDIGVVQDVEKRQKKRLLLDYLADNLKHHNWWAYRYFFCEFLALVNIIGKINLLHYSRWARASKAPQSEAWAVYWPLIDFNYLE